MKKLITALTVLIVLLGHSTAWADGGKESTRQTFGGMTAVGYSDGSVRIETGRAAVQLPAAPTLGPVHSLAFRPDGKILAIIYDQAYTFLDLTNLNATFDPIHVSEGCHVLNAAYDWLDKSQTAVFSIAVACNGRVEIQTSVWALEDNKTVTLTLPDAR